MGAFRSSRMDDFEIVAAPDPSRRASRVAVVGGGASGTLMALALARQRPDIDVTLIEPGQIGAGLAYGTSHGEHRLNVLPQRLSPFSDQPDDFAHWLVARGQIAEVGEKAFVPRALMGAYLSERLATLGRRVSIRHASVTTIDADAELIHVRLHSGEIVAADAVILATGHSWAPPRDLDRDVPPDASVTILGTGLGMVDRWLSLRESGHRGPVVAVSRHGLAPLSHGACPTPLSLPAVPLGWSVSQTMCWLRDLAAQVADWRMAVDAIRPHTQRIWQSWSQTERRRFLRHARRHWDVRRHRVAPDICRRARARTRRRVGPRSSACARDQGRRLPVRLQRAPTRLVGPFESAHCVSRLQRACSSRPARDWPRRGAGLQPCRATASHGPSCSQAARLLTGVFGRSKRFRT